MEKTIKMPGNIADAWLQALRSGEYKQDQGQLYDEVAGSYCCLGVLQKIVCGSTINAPGDEFPPKEWKDFYHITSKTEIFVVNYRDDTTSLTGLNDVWGKAFPEIADIIEQNLERLPDIPYQKMPYPIPFNPED